MENKKNTLMNGFLEMQGIKDVKRYAKHHPIFRESVADHSYMTTLLATKFMDELQLDLDFKKVVELITYHDMGELGLESDFDAVKASEDDEYFTLKKQTELDKVKSLANKYDDKILDLHKEYNEQKTREAKFVKAVDRLECNIYEMSRGAEYFDSAEFIATYANEPCRQFPELLPFLRELQAYMKTKYEEVGRTWKEEYNVDFVPEKQNEPAYNVSAIPRINKLYDTLIIGAGPCGYTAALDLSKQGLSVGMVDSGSQLKLRKCYLEKKDRCIKCDPCNIAQGFGGTSFFDGIKFSTYPAGTGLLNFGSEEEIKAQYERAENLINSFGKPQRTHPDPAVIKAIADEFAAQDIEAKYYNSQKVGRNTMYDIGHNINKELEENNTDIFYHETVQSVSRENGHFNVITNKKKMLAKNIIVATGRSGYQFQEKLAKDLGLEYDETSSTGELGVRIEMPHQVFDKINGVYDDLKLKRKIDNDNELRTFCLCYKGLVRPYVFKHKGEKIITLDGGIVGVNGDGFTTNSVNTSINHRFSSTENFDTMYDIAKRANLNNRPISQDMGAFMSDSNDININPTIQTLRDVEPANINNHMPQNSLAYIKSMIYDIDEVLPGFADKDNIVYAPTLERRGIGRFNLDKNFMTNEKGVYVGGDAAGHFIGVLQAMVSGHVIADDILEKNSR